MLRYVIFNKYGDLFDICDTKEKALKEKEFFKNSLLNLYIQEIDFNELEEKLYNVLKFMKSYDIP